MLLNGLNAHIRKRLCPSPHASSSVATYGRTYIVSCNCTSTLTPVGTSQSNKQKVGVPRGNYFVVLIFSLGT